MPSGQGGFVVSDHEEANPVIIAECVISSMFSSHPVAHHTFPGAVARTVLTSLYHWCKLHSLVLEIVKFQLYPPKKQFLIGNPIMCLLYTNYSLWFLWTAFGKLWVRQSLCVFHFLKRPGAFQRKTRIWEVACSVQLWKNIHILIRCSRGSGVTVRFLMPFRRKPTPSRMKFSSKRSPTPKPKQECNLRLVV